MIINYKLDPIYETILLLYNGYDMVNFKNKIIEQLNEVGGKGEEIYQKNFKTFVKYIKAFQKNRVSFDRDNFYFKDISFDFYISFITPFFTNKELISTVSDMNNDQIIKLILQDMEEIYEQELTGYLDMSHVEFTKTDNLMNFINKLDLSDNEKWKTLLIIQNPKDYYSYFADIIKKNIPAFEKSMETIKTSLDKYMQQYEDTFSTSEKGIDLFTEYKLTKCEISEVNPTMIAPTSIILLSKTCYYGLLVEKAMDDFGLRSNNKDYLLMCLKALSDSSKLEILSILKTSPKYSTELATQLGLTPATVSYHMNTLMTAKLVYVEKSNSKFYYHTNEKAIRELIEQLSQVLI